MRAFAAAALSLAALASTARGSETGELRLELRRLEALPELGDDRSGKAFALLGSVTVALEGAWSLRAEQAVLWIDPRAEARLFDILGKGGDFPLWALRAVYAEGGRVPAVFQSAGRIFRCSSLYYDLRTHEGLLLDAELSLRLDPAAWQTDPFVFRARRFRAVSPGRLAGEEVLFANSAYRNPRVSLRARTILIEDRRAGELLGRLTRLVDAGAEAMEGPTREEIRHAIEGYDPASFEGRVVELRRVTARAGDFPFFYWSRARSDGPPPFRLEFDAGSRGRLGSGAHVGVGQETRGGLFGWMFGAGYYPDRGPLVDPEVTFRTGGLEGGTGAAYLRDHGDDRGIVPPSRDRLWWHSRYRWDFAPGWRLDAEHSDLSDEQWLRTYAEGEFKEGKEQETLLHLRRLDSWGYAGIVGKRRSIGFLGQVEELPRAYLSVPVATILDRDGFALQAAGTLEVANLRRREPDGAADPDFRSFRLDVAPDLFASFDAGPVRIVPFLRPRATHYETSGETRSSASAGVRADTQASRRYGDLLHLVNLSVEAESLFHLAGETGLPAPIDDTDRVARFESLGFRARHRLRRDGAPRPFLDVDFFAAFFPGGERPFGARGEALLETDAKWRPAPDVYLRARAGLVYDPLRLETASIEGWWRARPDLAIGAGLRHLEGDSTIATLAAEQEVGTRWRLVGTSQFDLLRGEALDQGLAIQRLGQTVAISVRIVYDPGDGDLGFGLSLDLVRALRKRREQEGGPEERFAREELGWR